MSLIDDLERALASGTDAQRAEMLSRITDLFFAGADRYSASQVSLFEGVIAKLVAAIEPIARANLAKRLAPARNAPAGVIRLLAFDDNIEVARPVLSVSERLDEADLVANANIKSQQHLVAISERKMLSEAVTDVLVTRGDRQVVHSVSKNPGARISYAGFRLLVKRSTDDDKLAMLVGARGDLPRHHFQRLLDEASATVRARLLAENPGADSTIEGVVGEISTGVRVDTRIVTANYAAARAKLEALHRAGQLGEADVLGFARERRLAETVVALSLLCSVENGLVERALLAPSPDILLILAKLAGFSWATAKAILLLKTGDRGMAAPDVEQARESFGRLQIGTARHVLGFYRSRAGAAALAAP